MQLHSKYAMATSKDMDLEHMAAGARSKGLNLLGTGDFTHPLWFKELKSRLEPIAGSGLFSYSGMTWMLSGEVSTIYKQEGKTRKVHHLIYAPDFEIAGRVNDALSRFGDLASDGRPVLTGIDSPQLLETLTGISDSVVVIPAHVWTPYFSIFGSKSGFDSLEECYKDQAKKIFAVETGLSCYDGDTEVLTESGWKKFPDVTSRDRICTLNPQLDRIEYQRPTRVVKEPYSGKMYRLKTKRIDLLTTPNHRLLVTQFATRGPRPFKLRAAEDVFGKSKTFKKDGVWTGHSPEYFVLPSVKIRHGSRFYRGRREVPARRLPIKVWVEFFGWWIAEGHTTAGKNGDYCVLLSNSNTRVVSRFVRLFEMLGYHPLVLEPQPRRFQVRVRDFQLYSYLRQFGHSEAKFIPLEIKRLSKSLLLRFLKAYLKGDGHVYGRTRKGLSATTVSIGLRDDLQELALKTGLSAYYKAGSKRGTPIKSLHGGKYKQSHDAWVVYFVRHNRPSVIPSVVRKRRQIEAWEDFHGLVYCVSVPNHVIYVRRNGIPIWCGNSDPPMNWRLKQLDGIALMSNSDAHSPHPWRLGREANVFELSGLAYREIFDCVRRKDASRFLYTIEVDPAYGKYHYSGHKKCGVSVSPAESVKAGNTCPKCGRKLTVGVLQRVEELADRPDGYVPQGAIPFRRLLPLYEVISFATGVNRLYAKGVIEEQDKLIKTFQNELSVLLEVEHQALVRATKKNIADAILALRESRIDVVPGYDGVYGRPKFP